MSKLAELNIENMETSILRLRNEKQVNQDLLTFYKKMLKDKPHLKYSLSHWVLKLEEDIKSLDVEIDYLNQEYEDFIGINQLK
jgi:hypothetical protein